MATFPYICKFVGGPREGLMDYAEAVQHCDNGYNEDKSARRAMGQLVWRPELDNQPKFLGYYGPMWDGETKINGITYSVLRYETPEVYRLLSM